MSYGVNAPQGLVPLYNFKSGTLTSQTRPYPIYASLDGLTTLPYSIFTGDPVTLSAATVMTTGAVATSTAGTIAPYVSSIVMTNNGPAAYSPAVGALGVSIGGGTPLGAVGAVTARAQPILGVFQGCKYYALNGQLVNSPYWPGATPVLPGSQIIAYVYDDPDIVYDIQISSPTATWQNACFGMNFYAPGQAVPAVSRLATGANAMVDFVSPAAWNNPLQAWALNPTRAVTNGYVNNQLIQYPFLQNAATAQPPISTGNISNGSSNYYLSGGTATTLLVANTNDYDKTVATYPLKIIGLSPNPQNMALYQQALGASNLNNNNNTQPFLNVLVILNHHFLRQGTPGMIFV